MKGFSIFLILSALLGLTSCGKDNKSGQGDVGTCIQYAANGACSAYSSSGVGICTQYGANGVCSTYSSYNVGMSGSIDLNSIVSQIPCEYGGARVQVTGTANTSSFTTPGQSYLGVTSMGDIAIIQGTGQKVSPMVVFLCQSGVQTVPVGTANAFSVSAALGEFSTCRNLKTITAATLSQTLRFRDPVYGRGTTGQPFPFCY